ELNQVSLAQDLSLAASVLGPDGLVLFAAGPDSAVQVLDPVRRGDPVQARLAELFAPRQGRDAHYAPAPFVFNGEATAESVLTSLRRVLPAATTPLLV